MSALWTALMEGETKESLATMVCELRDQKPEGVAPVPPEARSAGGTSPSHQDLPPLVLAIEALANSQFQIDADGTNIGVSRQALEEVLSYLRRPSPKAEGTGEDEVLVRAEDAHREVVMKDMDDMVKRAYASRQKDIQTQPWVAQRLLIELAATVERLRAQKAGGVE